MDRLRDERLGAALVMVFAIGLTWTGGALVRSNFDGESIGFLAGIIALCAGAIVYALHLVIMRLIDLNGQMRVLLKRTRPDLFD